MIMGVVIFIFCLLGIFCYFGGELFLTYIGAVLCIIEQFIGISTGQQRGCSTTWISLLVALGITGAGNSFFDSLAICLCFENVICFLGGTIMLVVMGRSMSKTKTDDYVESEENDVEELYKCDNCGSLVKESDDECPNCGESFTEENNVIEKEKNDDKYDELIKVKDLYDKKILTKEEFEKEKKKILNK